MRISSKSLNYFIFIVVAMIGMVSVSLLGKLFFSALLWAVGGEFIFTAQEVKKCIILGLYGGGICGIGVVLLRFFNVKGF